MSRGISIICDNCGESSRPQSLEEDALHYAMREGFVPYGKDRDLCLDCQPSERDVRPTKPGGAQ